VHWNVWYFPACFSLYLKEVSKNAVSKTNPGFQNFYMVRQWAGGTIGLNIVCLMSRNLIRELWKKDGKKFLATATLNN